MKRLLVVFFLMGAAFGTYAGDRTTVEYPSFKTLKKLDKYNSTLVVTSVILDENETVINLEYTFAPKKKRMMNTMSIKSVTFAAFDYHGERGYVDIIDSEGVPMSPKSILVKSSETISLSLTFGPVPLGTEFLNLSIRADQTLLLSDIDLRQSNTSGTQAIGTFKIEDVWVGPGFHGQPINVVSNYVSNRLRYPEECRRNGISGTVTFRLYIEEDGSFSFDFEEANRNENLNAEAFRVVSELDGFTPARLFGKAVRYSTVFPVIFKLTGPETVENNRNRY